MRFRIQADELPINVLEAIGAIANKGLLKTKEVMYRSEDQLVTFLFQRFPIVGKSMLTGTSHSDRSVLCRVTIRHVSTCRIEDTGECEQVTILFGIGFKRKEAFLSSAEESGGTTCFSLICTVTGIDLEMVDE